MRADERPATEVAISWVRGHCPDLEIQDGGPKGFRAWATIGGREVMVMAPEKAKRGYTRDEIAQRLWELVRAAQGAPVRNVARADAAEEDVIRRIVLARAMGDDKEATSLEQQLVASRIGASPRALPRGIWQHRPENRDMPPQERQETYLNRDRKVY